MKISTRFTVGVHTLILIALCQDSKRVTSELIASSANINAVIIRKILGQLQHAGIISTRAGVGGSYLEKKPEEITLLDIYRAVSQDDEKAFSVFNFHKNPNQACPVGQRIHALLSPCLDSAQAAMEKELEKTTLADLMKEYFKTGGI